METAEKPFVKSYSQCIKSTWAVLAVILEIELFTQEHYKASIEPIGWTSPFSIFAKH